MLRQLLVYFLCYISYLTISVASKKITYENFSIIQRDTADFARAFENLVQRVQKENVFHSIFLLRNQPVDCVDEHLPLEAFEIPLLQFNASNPVYVRATGNSMLFAIVCIKKLTDKNFLLQFAKDLQHIRSRRILAIYNQNLTTSTQLDIVTFFQNCEQLKFLNVLLLHRDFAKTHVYHSFNQFPEFELEKRDLRATNVLYPNRFVNVRRKKLRILVDQIEPFTFLYSKGDSLIIDGYIGFMLKTFARRYNFQLWLPDNYESTTERVIYVEEIRQAARNGSIDVGASLLTPQKEANLHGYIYPIEFFQWLTMLPMEPTLETYAFFLQIFGPAVMLSLFVVIWCLSIIDALQVNLTRNNSHWNGAMLWLLLFPWHLDLLRGLVCQSCAVRFNRATRRIIFMLVFALGGTLNSLISTRLVNWWTVPPLKAPIEKFSQVAGRNLQIQVAEPDIADIKFYRGEKFWNQYGHIFNAVKSFDEYQDNIRNLDTRYGYMMMSLAWPIVEQRQNYFQRPLFRLSKSLYFTKGSLLSLPVSENLPYKNLLSDFGLRSRESGLLQHWYKKTFYAMVRNGRFNLKDPSLKHEHKVLTLREFEWVWIAYCVGILSSGLAFLLEIYWFKYKNMRKDCTTIHM